MKIAVATGIESFNNGIKEKLEQQHQVEEVHFQEFLLENEYEVVVLSKHLKGSFKITKLILDLYKQGKRVIFLTSEDEEDQEYIQYCISYGIHDILYKEITPERIENVILNPMKITDISHLIIEKEEPKIGESNPVPEKKEEVSSTKKGLFGRILKSRKNSNETSTTKINKSKSTKLINEEKKDVPKEALPKESEDNYFADLEDNEDPFDDTDNWTYMDNEKEISKEADQQVSKLFHEENHVSNNESNVSQNEDIEINNKKIEVEIEIEKDTKKPLSSTNHQDKVDESLSISKTEGLPDVAEDLVDENSEIQEDESSRISKKIEAQSNELATILREARDNENIGFKEVIKSNIGIIAITGTEKRVGVTHTALLLAHGAKKLGIKRVAIVEDNSSSKFLIIHKEFTGRENSKNFKLKGVDYFKKAESIANKIGEYDLVIIDMGDYRTSVNKALFKMAQKKIIVADSNFMNYESIIQFCKSEKDSFQSYLYALPLASIEEIKRFTKFFEVKKVVDIPYIRNPFSNKEAVEVVKNILGR